MKNLYSILFSVLIIFLSSSFCYAQCNIISTFAGNGTLGYSGDGGAATAAELNDGVGVAVDVSGNVYIADIYNYRIRKVNTSGIITTIAGNGTYGYSGDGGAATAADMYGSYGVAVDDSSNLYIPDYSRIRKVNTAGIITTIAGNGTPGYSGDGGAATAAQLIAVDVAIDISGNIYITDYTNSVVRKISSTGIITTIAGNGISGYSGDGGAATAAELSHPIYLTVDISGNVYIADWSNNCIRKVSSTGIITTIAGNGIPGYSGDGGAATAAKLNGMWGVTTDSSGNLYIADKGNFCIRKVNAIGIITTIAGNGIGGYTGDGGPATAAELGQGSSVAIDGRSNIYITDVSNDNVRRVEGSSIAPITGATNVCVSATSILSDITIGGAWSSSNTSVATISTTGVVTGVSAGTVVISYAGTGTCTSPVSTTTIIVNPLAASITGSSSICAGATIILSDGTTGGSWSSGNTDVATVGSGTGVVTGIAAGGVGISYTLATGCGVSYSVTVNANPAPITGSGGGIISTIAGDGTAGYGSVGVAATATDLSNPWGVAVDGSGNVYIADQSNNRVCKVNAAGIITTIAGNGTGGYFGDGVAATATGLNTPSSVAIDGSGNVYIADTYNERIRKVNISGIISTIAGNGTAGYGSDGVAATATDLNKPSGVAVDGSGNVYIADQNNNRIRKVNTSGIISTIAGNGSYGYCCDGVAATTTDLGNPAGVAVDGSGNVYIADGGNSRIRKVNTTSGIISTIAGNGTAGYGSDGVAATATDLNFPFGVAVDGSGNVYIADQDNQRVRKVNTSGIISTIAGNGSYGYCCDGGAATGAGLAYPSGVAVDGSGNVYIADENSHRINKVSGSAASGAVCAGATLILVDATSGGAWSSSNTAVGTITSSGVFSGVGAGTLIITYSVAGCGATAAMTVNPAPNAETITGTFSVCLLSTTTLSDVVAGGAWSSSNTSIATVGSTGIVNGVSAGTATISYSVINSCGTAVATKMVTVNPLPNSGSITGTATVCVSSTTTLNDVVTGGAWSSSNTSIATVGSTGIVNGVSAGTATISYSVTNSCGTAVATKMVTVNPLPNSGSITGTAIVCVSSTTTLSDVVTGGAWGSSNTSIATVGSTGIVNGVSAGTATISYSVTNSCGTAVATKMVTVNPLPNSGSITGTAIVCVSSTTTLSDVVTGGAWGSSNTSIATVGSTGIVNGVSAGTATISYSVTNSCGTAVATQMVTVNPLPNSGSITGTATVCVSSTTTLSDVVTGSAWSSSNTSIATVGSTGIVNGVSAGTATISYSVTNSCGTAVATKMVTVNPLPNSGSITGTATLCVSSTTTLNDVVTGGAWGSSNTSIATVGSTGIVNGVSAGTATISYSVTNSCGTAVATQMVTVNPLPNSGSITGTATVCVSSTSTLSDVVTGGAWSSSNTSIATVGSTGIVNGVSAGTATISYSVTNVCGTAVATKMVTVNPLPNSGSITGIATLCVFSTTTLNDVVTGGAWSSSNTSIATVGSTGIVNGVSAGTATISYSVTNSCGTAVATQMVTVNPLPNSGSITGTATVCVSSTSTLSDVVTGGAWSSSNTSIATVGSTGIVNGVSAGTATISYSVTNVCGTAVATKMVTVNPLPGAGNISGIDSLCPGDTITLTETATGGTWGSSNDSIANISTSGFTTAILPGTDTITYTVTITGCTSTTIFPFIVSSFSICPNSVNAISFTGNEALKVYPNPNNGSFTLLLSSAIDGAATVTITDILGEKVKVFTIASNIASDINLPQAAGVYLISVNAAGGRYVQKVTIIGQ